MMRRWTVRLAVCLVAGAATLTGCAEQQEASQSLPSESSSAAPTEEELTPLGPADMPMPDEARTQDAEGAEAFVRYYVDLINRTSTVMDAEPLRELSEGCRDCDRIAGYVEEDSRSGYHYRGGEISILAITPSLIEDERAELSMSVDQAAADVLDASGAPVADMSSPAYPGLSGGAVLEWDENRSTWVITTLSLG